MHAAGADDDEEDYDDDDEYEHADRSVVSAYGDDPLYAEEDEADVREDHEVREV